MNHNKTLFSVSLSLALVIRASANFETGDTEKGVFCFKGEL